MTFVIAALVGVALGIIYFGGLWLTIQKMAQVKHPVMLLTASFFVRTAVALVGFYLVSNGQIELLFASLVMFILTRYAFIRKIQPV